MKEETKRNKHHVFNRIARYYGFFYKYQKRKYDRVLYKIYDELGLSQHKDIIDIGCGTGALCSELYRRGFHVTGLDSSSEMLSEASEKLISENVKLYQLNFLEGTPFGDKSFDVSFASYVLHGMPYKERRKMYEEMKRITKHMIIIYDYNGRRSILINTIERMEGGDYFNFIKSVQNELKDFFNDLSVIDLGGHTSCYVLKLSGR